MSDRTLRRNDNATVELVFSEPVIGFDSDEDIRIPKLDQAPLHPHDNNTPSGTLSTMISSDNITWTGTFTPTADTEDWENELVLSDNYTDYDNNPGSGEEGGNYMVDDRDPSTHGSPTITLDHTLLTFGDTAELTVVFPEPVTANFYSDNATPLVDSFITIRGSNPGDINLDNATGTLTGQMSSDQANDNKTTWTGTFTPTSNVEVDNNTITLAASWYDQVGNPGTSVTTSNFKVDTKPPTVSSFTFSATDYTSFFNSDNIKFPGLQ